MATPTSKVRYNTDKLKIIIKSIETQVIEDDSLYFLAQPLGQRGIPSSQWFKFKAIATDDKAILDAMIRIESMLENRLVTGALQNKINNTMAIFLLKNKYGYKDNKQVDQNITITPILGGASNALDARTVIDLAD
jgi:hypothetical protein